MGTPNSLPLAITSPDNGGVTEERVIELINMALSDMGGTVPKVTFYGTNNHFTWPNDDPARPGYTRDHWPAQIAQMVDLGALTTRGGFGIFTDWKGELDSDADTYIDYIDNFAKPAGVVVCPVLMADYRSSADEAAAYQVGYNLGSQAARLKFRVAQYEIGNEEDSFAIIDGSHSGRSPADYDLHRFSLVRAYLRGQIAGIRSSDSVTPIVIDITWVHTAFLEMLWNGTAPDGSTGHPTVRWNKTALHWYTNNYAGNDNIENVIDQGGLNLLAWAKNTFGVPIHINEWGANSDTYSNNETSIKNAITGSLLMGKFQSVAKTYGIEHICYYQLTDGAAPGTPDTDREEEYGLVKKDNTTKKARYASFKTKIAAMPNPLA
ncbi:hypothetical protein [Caballeronia sp. TF1N1]|uniref:hypothetical protein n=1 Tax=Caballeronia sp. TF1N1 TaxID=2878153 RepID=UPI001FD215E4|nr:hypothetical protein [Caballeronia sp. TF1N1]